MNYPFSLWVQNKQIFIYAV